MSLSMRVPDQAAVFRRTEIVAARSGILPGEGVIDDEYCLRPYESDGLTAYRQPNLVVVLPETAEQVSRVLAGCHEIGVKVVPRGAPSVVHTIELLDWTTGGPTPLAFPQQHKG